MTFPDSDLRLMVIYTGTWMAGFYILQYVAEMEPAVASLFILTAFVPVIVGECVVEFVRECRAKFFWQVTWQDLSLVTTIYMSAAMLVPTFLLPIPDNMRWVAFAVTMVLIAVVVLWQVAAEWYKWRGQLNFLPAIVFYAVPPLVTAIVVYLSTFNTLWFLLSIAGLALSCFISRTMLFKEEAPTWFAH